VVPGYGKKAPGHIMTPPQRLRSAAQVDYNQGKQGCDGADDNTERLRSCTMRVSWQTKPTLVFLPRRTQQTQQRVHPLAS
jgi:hypothetical protein